MTTDDGLWTWDLWYPGAAATGLPFARGKARPAERILVHAAPDVLDVEIRDAAGVPVAAAERLSRSLDSPICALTVEQQGLRREDLWPGEAEIGLPVLLPGGEFAILKQWWHADDRGEWRWTIELYNSRR